MMCCGTHQKELMVICERKARRIILAMAAG